MEKEAGEVNPEEKPQKSKQSSLTEADKVFKKNNELEQSKNVNSRDNIPNHINIPETFYGEVEIEYIDKPEEKSSSGKQSDWADKPLWRRLWPFQKNKDK